jgi:hypothetical protein
MTNDIRTNRVTPYDGGALQRDASPNKNVKDLSGEDYDTLES